MINEGKTQTKYTLWSHYITICTREKKNRNKDSKLLIIGISDGGVIGDLSVSR